MEIGLGGGAYQGGILQKINKDRSILEFIDPPGIGLPGATNTSYQGRPSISLDMGLQSNDLHMGLFVRRHHAFSESTLLVPGVNGVLLGQSTTRTTDQSLGFELAHTIYLLNDRLRLLPGYGYLAHEESLESKGYEYVLLSGIGLGGFQSTVESSGELESDTSGFFLRLGMEYDLSPEYLISARIRYLPNATGSYNYTSNIIDQQFLTDGTNELSSLLAGPIDRSGSVNREYIELLLQFGYRLNENVRINAGWLMESSRITGTASVDFGLLIGSISDGTSQATGFLADYSLEPISDAQLYGATDLQTLNTLFVSFTFTAE